jgi:hypothetical protein
MSRRGRRLLVATQAVETGVPIHVRELLDGLAQTSVEIDVACPQGSLLGGSSKSIRKSRSTRCSVRGGPRRRMRSISADSRAWLRWRP